MNPTTAVLKSKEEILSLFNISSSMDKLNALSAMAVYAEQNSTAFVKWRTDQSIVMSHRYKLDLTFEEQYQLFLKENGL